MKGIVFEKIFVAFLVTAFLLVGCARDSSQQTNESSNSHSISEKVQHRLAKNHPVLIRRLNHLHPNIQQIIQQSLSLLPQRHSKQLTLYPAVNLAVTQPFTSLV